MSLIEVDICIAEFNRATNSESTMGFLRKSTAPEANQSAVLDSETDRLMGQIEFAFMCSMARLPSSREGEIVRTLYHDHYASVQDSPGAVDAIIGPTQIPAEHEKIEFAAWILTARTLLNLDEFIVNE